MARACCIRRGIILHSGWGEEVRGVSEEGFWADIRGAVYTFLQCMCAGWQNLFYRWWYTGPANPAVAPHRRPPLNLAPEENTAKIMVKYTKKLSLLRIASKLRFISLVGKKIKINLCRSNARNICYCMALPSTLKGTPRHCVVACHNANIGSCGVFF